MIDHDNLEEFRDPQTYDLEDEGYPALHPPSHVPLFRRSTQGENPSHSPTLCLSPRDGSLALLQWVSDPRMLRQLAARTSDRHFSLDDLCLSETGLARLSHALVWLLTQATHLQIGERARNAPSQVEQRTCLEARELMQEHYQSVLKEFG